LPIPPALNKKAPCHRLGAFDMEWWLHKERKEPYVPKGGKGARF